MAATTLASVAAITLAAVVTAFLATTTAAVGIASMAAASAVAGPGVQDYDTASTSTAAKADSPAGEPLPHDIGHAGGQYVTHVDGNVLFVLFPVAHVGMLLH